jgi:hypothetical protein
MTSFPYKAPQDTNKTLLELARLTNMCNTMKKIYQIVVYLLWTGFESENKIIVLIQQKEMGGKETWRETISHNMNNHIWKMLSDRGNQYSSRIPSYRATWIADKAHNKNTSMKIIQMINSESIKFSY